MKTSTKIKKIKKDSALDFKKIVEYADPFHNIHVLFPYNSKKLSPKKKNKRALQKELGLKSHVNVPLGCVFVSMIDEDGLHSIKSVFDGIMSIGIEIVIVDNKKHIAETVFEKEVEKYKDKVKIIQESEAVVSKVFSSSDIYLGPGKSRPHYLGQILALKFGVVPVVHHSEDLDGLISDYDPRTETGESFLFSFHNHWSFFAALVRALENYKLSYDWNTIVKNGMGLDALK